MAYLRRDMRVPATFASIVLVMTSLITRVYQRRRSVISKMATTTPVSLRGMAARHSSIAKAAYQKQNSSIERAERQHLMAYERKPHIAASMAA